MIRESIDTRMTRMEGLLAMLVRHAEVDLTERDTKVEIRRAYRRGYWAGRQSVGKPPTPVSTFENGLAKIETRRRNSANV